MRLDQSIITISILPTTHILNSRTDVSGYHGIHPLHPKIYGSRRTVDRIVDSPNTIPLEDGQTVHTRPRILIIHGPILHIGDPNNIQIASALQSDLSPIRDLIDMTVIEGTGRWRPSRREPRVQYNCRPCTAMHYTPRR
jgi:hypothetical protein